VNVPRTLGTIISAGKASMVELDTVLGTEDAYDLLEIISTDMYNQYVVNKASQAHA
jgi:hypothetical protein